MYDDTNINPADVNDTTTDYEFLRSMTVPAGDQGSYSNSPLSPNLGLHHHGGDEVHIYSRLHGKLAEVYPTHIDYLQRDANAKFAYLTGRNLPLY